LAQANRVENCCVGYFQEIHPPAFRKGTGDFARLYGLLLDGMQNVGDVVIEFSP
jgi:hypothetical protein